MDAKKLSQDRFGKYAASYVASRHHAGEADLERLSQLAGHHPGWAALDIATGGGHTALAVAPHVARVVASDITEPMLEASREFILGSDAVNVDFQLADAEDLPFSARSFDLVTCRVAARHFPHPARFVAEVARVLQPGGLFLLQDQVTPEDAGAAAWITDFERRLRLVKWVAYQEGTPEDLAELRARLRRAPPAVHDWMRPTDIETDEAQFSIHQCLFSARKTGLGDLGAGC
jgi:ubiquinone/menaquinone biosynthesis C-methylase UbiE